MTTMSTPHASVDHDGAGMIVRAEPLFTVGERTAKVRVPRKHRRRARSVVIEHVPGLGSPPRSICR